MASTSVLCLFTFMAMLCIVYAVEECTVEETEAYNKCVTEYTSVEDVEVCDGLKKSAVCFPPCYCDGLLGSMAFGLATGGCKGYDIKCGSAATLLASPLLLMLSVLFLLNVNTRGFK